MSVCVIHDCCVTIYFVSFLDSCNWVELLLKKCRRSFCTIKINLLILKPFRGSYFETVTGNAFFFLPPACRLAPQQSDRERRRRRTLRRDTVRTSPDATGHRQRPRTGRTDSGGGGGGTGARGTPREQWRREQQQHPRYSTVGSRYRSSITD